MIKNKKFFTILIAITLVLGLVGGLFLRTVVKALPNDYTSVYSWQFNTDGDLEGWGNSNEIHYLGVAGGSISGDIHGTDPYMFSGDYLSYDISNCSTIVISMKNETASDNAQLYFITYADGTWNEEKSEGFAIIPNDTGYTEYILDMSGNTSWEGALRRLRVDPSNGESTGKFYIDYIDIGNFTGILPTATPTVAPTVAPTADPTPDPTPDPIPDPTDEDEDIEEEDEEDEEDEDEDEIIDEDEDTDDDSEVPQTGQDYTLPIIFAGTALLMCAGGVYLSSRKRKEE